MSGSSRVRKAATAGLIDWSPIATILVALDTFNSVNPSLNVAILERIALLGSNRPWLPLWVDDLAFDDGG